MFTMKAKYKKELRSMLHAKNALIKKTDGWLVYYKNGYIADKRIFIALAIIILAYGTYLYATFGFTGYYYVSCPSDIHGGVCKNPRYVPLLDGEKCFSVECKEYLQAGESYGTLPPEQVTFYPKLCFLLILFALMLNTAFVWGGKRK